MNEKSARRRFITLERIVQTGLVNFVRNISLSVAATAVMVVTLTGVLSSVIVSATFNHSIADLTEKIDISVYLKDTVTEDQRSKLIDQLEGLENVQSVEYLSKEKALELYQETNQQDTELQVAISQSDNPLPATIRIKPEDPGKLEDIRQVLESGEVKQLQAEETSYSGDRKQAIDNITNATSFFTRAIVVGILIFAIISMLIIFNTIQMAIFNRRDELTIMRLLGASPWYIRGPFIVETMIYGIVAAVLSLTITNAIFTIQQSAFDASNFGLLDVKYANEYYKDNFLLFTLMQILAGMAIGAISALIATKRYLKERSEPLS